MSQDAHVVVIGAGTAGLVAALAAARRGIATMLVERRGMPSRHPRALALGASSVALLRGLDIDAGEDTPEHLLGPRLLEAADAAGVDVRLGVGFEAAERIAIAGEPAMRLRLSTVSGERYVTARFLVGADGARSHVRDVVGATLEGAPRSDRLASVWFEADVPPASRHALVPTDAPGRWLLRVPIPEGPRPRGDAAVAHVRAATGLPDLAVTVLDVVAWEARGLVASSFASASCALVGDAAHLLAPSRSAAVDLAIGDGVAVADALAGGSLARYDDERRAAARALTT